MLARGGRVAPPGSGVLALGTGFTLCAPILQPRREDRFSEEVYDERPSRADGAWGHDMYDEGMPAVFTS